ncbi:hypothetical protein L226DRAFT_22696 [Lentinus tigrinus ALCF2SS1-7]|uniref:uncharacterized protein n=1 Tax=Lentinus tigrinus ALCF2SS1-7 TaxID=1328758 RepID=UPI0011662731|nr:hypothetical protein L226DRAFT_22696 [Lentinus tigrinus ALCF2SS1-7]
MDVATLRAEIKTWERDFRATHGRDPSIQEIKDQPAMAAKYKRYKSLSKASSSGSLSRPARSSTPPPPAPRQPPASSILPKPRAVKVDPPLATSNPFSPVKNRKKFTDPAPSLQRASNQSRPNPFATPSKPKNKPHPPRRSPSPDPFPPIQPLLLVPRPPLSPAADSAVTRARKRLRGEPVSPSPVKEKRQRVTSQAALSLTSRAALLHSPDVSDGDEPTADPNDTIIADTPMKPRSAGRNFKVLFDDALSNTGKRTVNGLPSRKAHSSAPTVLGVKRASSRAFTPSSDEEDDWSLKPSLKSLGASTSVPAKLAHTKTRAVNGKYGIPKALVPTKDNLWADAGPSKASQSKVPSFSQNQSNSHAPSRPPNKRALDDDHDDVDHGTSPVTLNGYLNLPLIPPSPPPPDTSKPSGSKYADKGKAKAGLFGRKKAKLVGDGDAEAGAEDESPEDEIQVREIDPLTQPPKDVDPDSDWEAHWRPRPDSDDPTALSTSGQTGKFEVNLPDELQRVLAISPGSRSRDTEEERAVRSLLYGSRETHYDASKGGEIWDIGEDSEHATGTEEEWEGEPVPWEVGEL